MTLEDLQKLVSSVYPEDFKKAFRKTESRDDSSAHKNGMFALLKGNFVQGRTPFIHQVTLPDGSQIRIKFYNVVKHIRNSKGQEVMGKESFLSYIDVSVHPVNKKGYSFTADVVQVVWGTSKSKAQEKHTLALNKLNELAVDLGIDLSNPASWCSTYSENY